MLDIFQEIASRDHNGFIARKMLQNGFQTLPSETNIEANGSETGAKRGQNEAKGRPRCAKER